MGVVVKAAGMIAGSLLAFSLVPLCDRHTVFFVHYNKEF